MPGYCELNSLMSSTIGSREWKVGWGSEEGGKGSPLTLQLWCFLRELSNHSGCLPLQALGHPQVHWGTADQSYPKLLSDHSSIPVKSYSWYEISLMFHFWFFSLIMSIIHFSLHKETQTIFQFITQLSLLYIQSQFLWTYSNLKEYTHNS